MWNCGKDYLAKIMLDMLEHKEAAFSNAESDRGEPIDF